MTKELLPELADPDSISVVEEVASSEFIQRTNDEYTAWCKTYYSADALDTRGMPSLHGLWAWQEQERRKAPAQPAIVQPVQPEQEPIYQYQLANGTWTDQAKESYDYNVKLGQAVVRALHTQPVPPNEWKEAVLDALSTTHQDFPEGTAPHVIINAISDWHVRVALNPELVQPADDTADEV